MAKEAAGGKGEIETKLEQFVDTSFERFNLNGKDSTMSKDNAQVLMKELMNNHYTQNLNLQLSSPLLKIFYLKF